MKNQKLLDTVQGPYAAVARSGLSNDSEAEAVVVSGTGTDLNVYTQASSGGCCSSASQGCCNSTESSECPPPLHDGLAQALRRFDANVYAASVRVHAVKSLDHRIKNLSGGISFKEGNSMKTIQVFDKPMCCSTGVCGPQVDPVLPRFAADLDWLKSQGHSVERFNLAQQPGAFIQNQEVHQLLATRGTDCLPVILIDGRVVSQHDYPSRDMFALWTAGSSSQTLPIAGGSNNCCSGSSCC